LISQKHSQDTASIKIGVINIDKWFFSGRTDKGQRTVPGKHGFGKAVFLLFFNPMKRKIFLFLH
jgi:hypothetical protein